MSDTHIRITHQDFELAVLEKLRLELLPLGIKVFGTEDGHIHEVQGRYSLVGRQLDAAAYRPGDTRPFLIVDAKRQGERIDVKQAEAFLGMVEDVGAAMGLLVAPLGFTHAAERRVAAASTHVRIMTIEDALTFKWLPVARRIYPFDWIFREELALALRRLHDGVPPIVLIDALDTVAFEEWEAFVAYALEHHSAEAIEFLQAVAGFHEDTGWQYNAVRHLMDTGNLDRSAAVQLLGNETDLEIQELLAYAG
jgi:Restriction endonuclease